MPNRTWIASLVWGFALGACQLAGLEPFPTANATATPTLAAEPTAEPTRRVSSSTRVQAGEQAVNCRYGPGLTYEVVGGLRAGQVTTADGRNDDGTWLHVHDPGNPGGFCWVAVSAIETGDNLQALDRIARPDASVLRVSVRAEPQRITVECADFPQFFHITGEITANGPLIVTWQWELNSGELTPQEILAFDQAGTRVVERTATAAGPNDYRVRLHVFDPDEVVAQAAFYATCTP